MMFRIKFGEEEEGVGLVLLLGFMECGMQFGSGGR